MARSRSKPKATNPVPQIETKESGKVATLTLGGEATAEDLASTRGGRGHGEYDAILGEFLESGFRGSPVNYEGVKANSIKTSLKNAIKRAVEADKIAKDEVEVRGKDEKVFLVRPGLAAE